MESAVPIEVERIARQRIAAKKPEILKTLTNVAEGNPLASETSQDRLVARLMAKNSMAREEAEATAMGIRAFAGMSKKQRAEMPMGEAGAEAVWGQTIDFVGVAFLERGQRAAKAVARVAFRSGRGWGSGFMVSDRLFLTNHHVIPSPEAARDLCAEFDFELDIRDSPLGKTNFAFDPGVLFVTDPVEGLDFTLIAIGDRLSGPRQLSYYGYCPLSDAPDKHAIGEVVNIVQHPRARYKEVVLRENRLVARSNEALHYVADTEPGSSGSPVFNNEWQPVALHHWGGPFRAIVDDNNVRIPREVNEGLRISSIVTKIRSRLNSVSDKQRAFLQETLRLWEAVVPPNEAFREERAPAEAGALGPRENQDGSVTWTFPLEITVRAPLVDSQRRGPSATDTLAVAEQPAAPSKAGEALKPSSDYGDRGGYEPGFIPGHVVPLPALSEAQKTIAARNREAGQGDDPFELKYHHFSAVVNAERKLTFFTACNIDGRKSKFINRRTGDVEPLDPANTDHGLMESLLMEGAEATEEWSDDLRLLPTDVAGQPTYDKQLVPGFPTSTGMARTLRMFQRGHLVRRLDPTWGTDNQALLAEADTFHFTNCVPQVGFFNMGRASPDKPGTGGGKLWRAVENLVLRNARTMSSKVTSFTGPIFGSQDRTFRTIQIPNRFFKIAVWADQEGKLRSLGMIADQSKVFGPWPEALFESGGAVSESLGPEAFQDTDEIERVDDFLTTITAIENATDLDFGEAVRAADIRAGESISRPASLDAIDFGGRPRRRTANAHPAEKRPARKRAVKKRPAKRAGRRA